MENNLKRSLIECQLLEPIYNYDEVINNMMKILQPYLDMNISSKLGNEPIYINPNNNNLEIYFDGSKESMGEILNILITRFRSNVRLYSFAQQLPILLPALGLFLCYYPVFRILTDICLFYWL